MTTILYPPFPPPPPDDREPLPAAPETGADHVRNSLQMLLLAEVRLGEIGQPDPALAELLAGAIVRLYRAVAELEKSDV